VFLLSACCLAGLGFVQVSFVFLHTLHVIPMGNGRVLVIHRESWLASWRWVWVWVWIASRFKLRHWVKEKDKSTWHRH
jgi:hypothetical protein